MSLQIPFIIACPEGQFGGNDISLRKAFSSLRPAVHEMAVKYSNDIMKIIIFFLSFIFMAISPSVSIRNEKDNQAANIINF